MFARSTLSRPLWREKSQWQIENFHFMEKLYMALTSKSINSFKMFKEAFEYEICRKTIYRVSKNWRSHQCESNFAILNFCIPHVSIAKSRFINF